MNRSFSVDDTTVPKSGKQFDAVSLLHDHACYTGKAFYVNGHCFVSLTLSVPVLNQHEGKAPLIRYLAVPAGYRMTKEQTKLELAGDLIEEVMPLLKDRQVLLLFDSWYAKSSLIELLAVSRTDII